MTLYYSEKTLQDEQIKYLKKDFPRGDIRSNTLEIARADTIDYPLFLKYFDCAVAKQHELYTIAISQMKSSYLENRLNSWVVQSNGEKWVDPLSGPDGKNVVKENVHVIRFYLYIDDEAVLNYARTVDASIEEALIGVFIEVKHALFEEDEEPIEIFRGFYEKHAIREPKTDVAKFLASILTVPH